MEVLELKVSIVEMENAQSKFKMSEERVGEL